MIGSATTSVGSIPPSLSISSTCSSVFFILPRCAPPLAGASPNTDGCSRRKRTRFARVSMSAPPRVTQQPHIGLGVDEHDRQPRILPLELRHHSLRLIVELEEADEETVRADQIAHRIADVFERSELKNLHVLLRKRPLRRDAHERVALI